MISRRSKNFKKAFASLPSHVQALAVKNFHLWLENPDHPLLNFKPLEEPKWSVRIGDGHRAVGKRDGSKITWVWIGSHEAYSKLF